MSNYRIIIKSNEHPRTINTFRNARTNFSVIGLDTKAEFIEKLNELIKNNEIILDTYYKLNKVNHFKYINN